MISNYDKWLTTPPEQYPSDDWYESVEEEMTEEFWLHHENVFLESGTYNDWMLKLCNKREGMDFDKEGYPIKVGYMTAQLAAKIVQRAHKIYFENKKL
jgi:hypothetical protein